MLLNIQSNFNPQERCKQFPALKEIFLENTFSMINALIGNQA